MFIYSFEMWFDIEVLSSNNADAAIIEEEKEKNILVMLHQVCCMLHQVCCISLMRYVEFEGQLMG